MNSTKICGMCLKELPNEDFSWKNKTKGILQWCCRNCQSVYVKKHYKDNTEYYAQKAAKANRKRREDFREYISEYKRQRGCLVCKEKSPCCLDFHHLDSSLKDTEISRMIWKSQSELDAEISKCCILCSNCHRKLHAGLISI
jgi:hypothetical protein